MKPAYQYEAKIINVVDGDTVDAYINLGFSVSVTVRLRILDLDTPEIFHPTYDNEREQGIAAKELAEKFLLDRDVTIQTHKKGKYGRYLASIDMDGVDFAIAMKQAGFIKP